MWSGVLRYMLFTCKSTYVSSHAPVHTRAHKHIAYAHTYTHAHTLYTHVGVPNIMT